MATIFKIDNDEAIEHIVHILNEADTDFICKVYKTVCNGNAYSTEEDEINVPEIEE